MNCFRLKIAGGDKKKPFQNSDCYATDFAFFAPDFKGREGLITNFIIIIIVLFNKIFLWPMPLFLLSTHKQCI
jgi:hypothetical protein